MRLLLLCAAMPRVIAMALLDLLRSALTRFLAFQFVGVLASFCRLRLVHSHNLLRVLCPILAACIRDVVLIVFVMIASGASFKQG